VGQALPLTPTRPHGAAALAGLLAGFLALWAPTPGQAQGPEADAAAARLNARLAADFALTDAEARLMAEPVRVHLYQGGREQTLRDVLGTALKTGCRGPCPAEAVRSLNRARSAGLSFMDARGTVLDALATLAATPGPGGTPPADAALADALRADMDARFGRWLPGTEPAPPSPPPPPPSKPAEGWPPKRPRLP
jgi:hypothetical protein